MSAPRTPIVAESFLRSLVAHGVDFLFANPGTDFPPIVEAYARAEETGAKVPRAVMVPHENLAMAMAHGAYLMTGRAQAVMVHVNVGTANTLNMLANLARDNVPLLLCAGRTPITESGAFGSRNRPIHWAQEMFDQAGMARELVKWDYEFKAPARIETVVARALEVAETSPQGPVYLTLPREPLSAPLTGAPTQAARLPIPSAPHPDPAAIATLAAWLGQAKRPLILASAAGRTAGAVEALSAIAAQASIPVVQAWPRVMNLPSAHPMNFGGDAAPFIKDADLVIVLEADVPWLSPEEGPPPSAKVVQIGEDPAFQRYPMRSFRRDLAITSTVEAALSALLAAVKEQAFKPRADLVEKQAARRAAIETAGKPAKDKITLSHLSRAIAEICDAETLLFNEYSLQLDQVPRSLPNTIFGLSPAGGLGWALGAAIGAKMAAPDKFAIAAVGDGAYIFSNPTACHWMQDAARAPVLTVIFNNSRYGAVRRATQSMFSRGAAGKDECMGLADLGPSPPFHEFVRAQGGFGEIVDRPDELAGVLARAKQAVVGESRQALVNVICPY